MEGGGTTLSLMAFFQCRSCCEQHIWVKLRYANRVASALIVKQSDMSLQLDARRPLKPSLLLSGQWRQVTPDVPLQLHDGVRMGVTQRLSQQYITRWDRVFVRWLAHHFLHQVETLLKDCAPGIVDAPSTNTAALQTRELKPDGFRSAI